MDDTRSIVPEDKNGKVPALFEIMKQRSPGCCFRVAHCRLYFLFLLSVAVKNPVHSFTSCLKLISNELI